MSSQSRHASTPRTGTARQGDRLQKDIQLEKLVALGLVHRDPSGRPGYKRSQSDPCRLILSTPLRARVIHQPDETPAKTKQKPAHARPQVMILATEIPCGSAA